MPRVNSSFVDLVSHFLTFRCAKLFTSPPNKNGKQREGGDFEFFQVTATKRKKKPWGSPCALAQDDCICVCVYVRRRRRRAEAYMAREKETAAADPPSIESTRKKMRFSSSSPALVHV